ncbi:hypothetical protein [Halosimplex amylolyticum]|uniref:hypothetical protein n=1 Tax=Halosimplex amylolyticum TaxID=3396616 RepID=UPI003F556360
MEDAELTGWLLAGDPAIRWQVKRDLLDEPVAEVEAERERVARSGWGQRLLDEQDPDGRWAGSDGEGEYYGLYTPKWTSTTYTLLLLRRTGLPAQHPAVSRGCRALVEGCRWPGDGHVYPWLSETADACVDAMILGLLEWADYDAPEERSELLTSLLDEQRADGGWNCDAESSVGSVHTTISTLEALHCRRENLSSGGAGELATVEDAMASGREYLLERSLFRSRRTGDVIRPEFTRFSFPPRWFYDVLRALDHLQASSAPTDPRAGDAVDLLREKRRADGTWPLQNRHPGRVYFEMETVGEPSRWNTLRALRVLRWWESSPD